MEDKGYSYLYFYVATLHNLPIAWQDRNDGNLNLEAAVLFVCDYTIPLVYNSIQGFKRG